MVPSGGVNRLGMLTTSTAGLGKKEGRMRTGSKMTELNRNLTPDQYQDQSLDLIPTDLPPIILQNPHHHCLHIFQV